MKLAVIGASMGQFPLCLKAKELGHTVICFAWENGAVCKDIVDTFYPVSIADREEILKICRRERIDGVVSNASDATAEVVSYIATTMGLHGVKYDSFNALKDKSAVRQLSANIPELSQVKNEILTDDTTVFYPCILKPVTGNSKKGVGLANGPEDIAKAMEYAKKDSVCKIIMEQYIIGREISVESISYEGRHQVIQITDKDSSGAPHFVELGHHQPTSLSASVVKKIHVIIPKLLESVGIDNGATHVEMKITDTNEVYLIEVNPRGGGDEISNLLVQLSSGIDYLRCMIEVALGVFKEPVRISEPAFAGIYYLCQQTADLLPFFRSSVGSDWVVDMQISNLNLQESHTNYERDGYLIYKHSQKIIPSK